MVRPVTQVPEVAVAVGIFHLQLLDLVVLGLSGMPGSEENRKRLVKKLDLPERISPNGLLQALNLCYTLEELRTFMERIND